MKEMIRDGENGLLADFFDADEIARRAVDVLRDPAAFRTWAAPRNRLIAEKYSLDVVLPEMIEFYQRVIERKQPAER